jgi:arylsulfatase A-like enzyme
MLSSKASRRDVLKSLGTGAAGLGLSACGLLRRERPPNIVIFLADDLGYGDLGCYGAKDIETPNLDRMAAEGLRFTSFYVPQAVCSASRAALLTGCYPNRVSVLHALMPQAENGISSEEETIAELLHERGYVCGVFGKWHLGHHPEFLPLRHGFDEYFGLPYSNDMWPVGYDGVPVGPDDNKARHPYPPLIDGEVKVGEVRTLADQDRLTALTTARALRFIEKNKDRPFFLYVPFSMPHVPLGVSEAFRGKSRYGPYGDVIMEIDDSVGRVLRALREAGIDRRTFVTFFSDNGPWLNFGDHAGLAGPLREGKGTEWEGGVRVPCVMRWPGRIRPASVCQGMAASMDILPTVAHAASARLPRRPIDGLDLLPLLLGGTTVSPRQELYYYYGTELHAVRRGRWKLHVPHGYPSYEGQEPGRDGFPGKTVRRETGYALYDLESDIGERTNLVEMYPDVVRELMDLAGKARADLGDGTRPGPGVRPGGVRRPPAASSGPGSP